MKEDHIFLSNGRVQIKEINQWDAKFCSNGLAYCFGLNHGSRGEHLTIQLLWATARLLVTLFQSYLPSGWISLKEMRAWDQYKISSYCSYIWWESRESRGRGSLRFPCVTPVVETSSDRVTFRIPSNINDGAPLWKQSMDLTRWLFPQKSSTADLRPDFKCGSD